MKRLEVLRYNPALVINFLEPTHEEVLTAYSSLQGNSSFGTNSFSEFFLKFPKEPNNRQMFIINTLIKNDPKLVQYMPFYLQTPEICKYVFDSYPDLIRYLTYQTQEMCDSVTASCLEGNFSHFKFFSYEQCLKAVEIDGVNLRYVPEDIQDFNLVCAAIDNWPKSVRWSKLKGSDQDNAVIRAFTKNPQAYFEMFETEHIREVYTMYCIEHNYFPDNASKFSFTQSQLLEMFKARLKWIEIGRIFNLLDDKHKWEALGFINDWEGTFVYADLSVEYVTDKKLMLKLISLGVRYSFDRMSNDDLMEIIRLNPAFVDRLSGEKLNDDFIYKAAKIEPSILRYLSNLDESRLVLI